MRLQRNLFVAALASVCAVGASAQTPNTERASTVSGASIPHSTASVRIDGVLDDAIWRDALRVPLTIETSPRENLPAEVETTALLVENGDQLLVAFDARDPDPSSIRAYLRDRDSAFNDDFVGIVLDTFNDERRAFEFFVNPLGVQMDMILDEVNGGESDSWNAIWDSGGEINGNGFTVEMAIPFSQLRFPNTAGAQTWGIDLLRFRPRAQQARISTHARDRNINCYLCQAGKFDGFENAEPGRALEVVPTLTGSRTDRRPSVGAALAEGDFDTEVGLGVRWGITPDLTLDLALNPDFSQVEADVQQLEENTTFALSYEETRPFFLESQDFFSSPLQAVFTRSVADPDIGTKFTGRVGPNTIGMFAANDTVTNLLFPGSLGSRTFSLAEENDAFVGRYTRAFGKQSTIGALVTSRQGDGYGNEVAGVDGRYYINDQNTLRFQYLDSHTEYPSAVATRFAQASQLDGDAFEVEYGYSSREWFAQYTHQEGDPDFRADLGFISRVGVARDRVEMGRTWQGTEDTWYNRFTVGIQGGRLENTAGQLLDQDVQPFFNFQGPLQSFMRFGAGPSKEFWNGQVYDLNGGFMFGQVRPRRGLSVNMQLGRGERIDFANNRVADQRSFGPQVDWNATRHLLVRLRYTSQRLSAKDGPTIFQADLADMRFTWQFNVRSFVRLTMQSQDIERNVALYLNPATDPDTKTLASQVLYSYKLNPQTVLFAGYSDNRLEDDFGGGLEQTGRTLFLKLSYAWTP